MNTRPDTNTFLGAHQVRAPRLHVVGSSSRDLTTPSAEFFAAVHQAYQTPQEPLPPLYRDTPPSIFARKPEGSGR
ncbi:MAG: hypothetical protein WAZ18_00975 [Alphaproteobacteria bacterium]